MTKNKCHPSSDEVFPPSQLPLGFSIFTPVSIEIPEQKYKVPRQSLPFHDSVTQR